MAAGVWVILGNANFIDTECTANGHKKKLRPKLGTVIG